MGKHVSTEAKCLKRPFILVSVMLGMFLAAIEATIVATAMPSIVADLGGFSSYSWVFSSYLLTNAATVLIFGKLSDLFGRKPIYVMGVLIFLTGSTLAGVSQSMTMLIVSRFIQGVGSGALMPIATTIVGDIYNKKERSKIQGYLSSIWGISAISGPLLGGFFVDYLSWRYIFWMNIPLGIISMVGIIIFLRENKKRIDRTERSIDYAGTFWIVIAVSSFMLILVEGGTGSVLDSPLMMVLLTITVIGLLLFIVQEKKASVPMIPFELWKYRAITVANLTTLTTGMILIGVSSFLPAFVQGAMGQTATLAGFTLTTMSIGWPIASMIAGRLLLVFGYRYTSLIVGFSLVIGGLIFFSLTPEKGPIWAGMGSFFIGMGMGFTQTPFIVAIQSAVGWDMRGSATAANTFMRSLGSAIGAAFLGGLLNSRIQSTIIENKLENELSIDAVNHLLDPNKTAQYSDL